MSEIIQAISDAVEKNPEAVALRVHLAQLLLDSGDTQRALLEVSKALSQEPGNAAALALLTRIPTGGAEAPAAPEASTETATQAPAPASTGAPAAPAPAPSPETATPESAASAPAPDAPPSHNDNSNTDIDWDSLENDLGVSIDPPFITPDETPVRITAEVGDHQSIDLAEERPDVTLDDVGGLDNVKQRIRVAFLEPMRNPEVARAFGKSLRGGLLLYGPPGTGKTFLARAIAGELKANFLSVTLADVLDSFIGASEQNVHKLFENARSLAPCVIFIDELDALGGKRTQYSNAAWMRNVVNQLLQELDGVGTNNDGVFVLGATNHPWNIDEALLRPGRFDRIVLVTAPDEPARESILRSALSGRPIEGIDLGELVRATHGYSGADLTYIATTAAEKAMTDSLRSGTIRPINMTDLREALTEVKPSTGAWLQSARNVVNFANADGRYDELTAYLRAEKIIK